MYDVDPLMLQMYQYNICQPLAVCVPCPTIALDDELQINALNDHLRYKSQCAMIGIRK